MSPTEKVRCVEDFGYFFQHHLNIFSPQYGWRQGCTLWSEQEKLANVLNGLESVIVRKPRQKGFSTLVLAWLLWKYLFHWQQDICVVVRRDATRIVDSLLKMFPEIKESSDRTGNRLKHRENLSQLEVVSAGSDLRGMNPEILFADEAAFFSSKCLDWLDNRLSNDVAKQTIVVSSPCYVGDWFDQLCEQCASDNNPPGDLTLKNAVCSKKSLEHVRLLDFLQGMTYEYFGPPKKLSDSICPDIMRFRLDPNQIYDCDRLSKMAGCSESAQPEESSCDSDCCYTGKDISEIYVEAQQAFYGQQNEKFDEMLKQMEQVAKSIQTPTWSDLRQQFQVVVQLQAKSYCESGRKYLKGIKEWLMKRITPSP